LPLVPRNGLGGDVGLTARTCCRGLPASQPTHQWRRADGKVCRFPTFATLVGRRLGPHRRGLQPRDRFRQGPQPTTLPSGASSRTRAEPVQPVGPEPPFPPLRALGSLPPSLLVMTLPVLSKETVPKSCLVAAIVTRPTIGPEIVVNPSRNSTLRLSRAIWAGADHWGQSR
jgi:hypothetical protein